MSYDIECPYCKKGQDICHDDGVGYEEDVEHEQYCDNCDKYFKYTTSISYHYDAYCQEGDHVMEQCPTKGCESLWTCKNCERITLKEKGL